MAPLAQPWPPLAPALAPLVAPALAPLAPALAPPGPTVGPPDLIPGPPGRREDGKIVGYPMKSDEIGRILPPLEFRNLETSSTTPFEFYHPRK